MVTSFPLGAFLVGGTATLLFYGFFLAHYTGEIHGLVHLPAVGFIRFRRVILAGLFLCNGRKRQENQECGEYPNRHRF